jgi:hypothetical protein
MAVSPSNRVTTTIVVSMWTSPYDHHLYNHHITKTPATKMAKVKNALHLTLRAHLIKAKPREEKRSNTV